jgi:hypothetical protein
VDEAHASIFRYPAGACPADQELAVRDEIHRIKGLVWIDKPMEMLGRLTIAMT